MIDKQKYLSLLLVVAMVGLPANAAPLLEAHAELEGAGPWIVRAYFHDPAMVAEWAARRAPWEVNREHHYIVVEVSGEVELRQMEALGFRVVADTDLMQEMQRPRVRGAGGGIPGYGCYRTVEETFAAAAQLAVSHPDLAEWLDIGDSWVKNNGQGGGYDINLLKLTNQNIAEDKPVLLLLASIHAREYAPAELITRFAEHLLANYATDADVAWLLDTQEIHLVLQGNPDGRKKAEAGTSWRKNTNENYCGAGSSNRGADLNRNYPWEWGAHGGSSGNECDDTYRGPVPVSEPETEAITTYMQSIFVDQRPPDNTTPAPDDTSGLFIDVHSYSQLVLWPWGYTATVAPNGAALQTLGRKLAFHNSYYPEQAIGLYPTDGTTDDFAYGELGIAAYTFELGTSFFQDCATFEQTIFPDNLSSLLYAAKAVRAPYLLAGGPDVVDVQLTQTVVEPGELIVGAAQASDQRFSQVNGTESVQVIADAQAFIDTPPWEAGAVALTVTPTDSNFDTVAEGLTFSLPSVGLPQGRHMLYLRAQDASAQWGAVSAGFFYILDPADAGRIQGVVTSSVDFSPIAATVTTGPFQVAGDPGDGSYSLMVPPGTYDVTYSAADHVSAVGQGITVTAGGTFSQNMELTGICDLLTDDVEGGVTVWSADAPWAITDTNANSPTHSWTDSPGGDYASFADVSLTSSEIDFSADSGVSISFAHYCDTESGYDYGRVEAFDGSVWQEVFRCDDNAAWANESLALPMLDGVVNARIRFRFTSDSGIERDGWYVDDIVIKSGGERCFLDAIFTSSFEG